jgi:hypothetical protein
MAFGDVLPQRVPGSFSRKSVPACFLCSPGRTDSVRLCYTIGFNEIRRQTMLLSKEYVGYLARQMTQKLISGEFIETKNVSAVTEAMNRALLEELQLEDRINDEVRLILEAYQDEMSKAGASYQEMFKKVKGELVRKYKAVL